MSTTVSPPDLAQLDRNLGEAENNLEKLKKEKRARRMQAMDEIAAQRTAARASIHTHVSGVRAAVVPQIKGLEVQIAEATTKLSELRSYLAEEEAIERLRMDELDVEQATMLAVIDTEFNRQLRNLEAGVRARAQELERATKAANRSAKAAAKNRPSSGSATRVTPSAAPRFGRKSQLLAFAGVAVVVLAIFAGFLGFATDGSSDKTWHPATVSRYEAKLAAIASEQGIRARDDSGNIIDTAAGNFVGTPANQKAVLVLALLDTGGNPKYKGLPTYKGVVVPKDVVRQGLVALPENYNPGESVTHTPTFDPNNSDTALRAGLQACNRLAWDYIVKKAADAKQSIKTASELNAFLKTIDTGDMMYVIALNWHLGSSQEYQEAAKRLFLEWDDPESPTWSGLKDESDMKNKLDTASKVSTDPGQTSK